MLTAYSACCMLDNMYNYRVSILSGSKKQASMAYKYCSDVFSLSTMKDKVVGDVTLLKTDLIGGGGAEILAASEKQTRAPRADMIIIDESCSAKSAVIKSVFGQVITAGNIKIVILTTPDNPIHVTKQWWDDWEKIGITRAAFMTNLRERGINTQVHFIPVHTQPFYRHKFGSDWGDCPTAEKYYQKCLSIPLYPAMSDSDVEKVISNILSITDGKK